MLQHRSVLVALAVSCAAAASAQPVTVEPMGEAGAYTGFSVHDGAAEVTSVLFQVGARWTAQRCDRRHEDRGRILEFADFDTSGTGGTPVLGPGSYVRVGFRGDETYPTLEVRLEVQAFDRGAWRLGLGQDAPLCFLALPLDAARLWYVHGLLCPTPVWDPYPLTRPTVRGSWAEGWSYGAALGALTVPAMGLWDDRSGCMVAYEWARARLTDKSDKDLGIAYCAGVPGWARQCVVLLSNAQADWTELSYPATPVTIATHLRVLYSQSLPATEDVNRLVLQSIVRDDRDVLPVVPQMNDLSWMVPRRLDELGVVAPAGGAILHTVEGGIWGWNQFFYDPGTVLYSSDFRGTDQMYRQGRREAIARFEGELSELLGQAHWEEIDGEKCCTWRYPLSGSWTERMGGEAADTEHHVASFAIGAGLLACYANTGRQDLLPYIDGLFSWARHYVFTRGDIADIPESMFTLQSRTLALDFLMNYRRLFAYDGDPARRARAEAATELAHVVVYRNANVTIGDSDERDDVSPAFMMPGNMAKFWLGQISNAELSEPFAAMVLMYVETGDPVLKWLVRGALDRWWVGYKEDCWHTAENIDIWGVSTGSKGMQTGIHGPCDSFFEWAQPVGDARMHVTCGQEAAIAFCQGTRAMDVDEYRFRPPLGFGFRVARIAAGEVPEPFSIIVSAPWRDLAGLPVSVDGIEVPAESLRVIGTYREHLYIPGVRVGSTVAVGDVAGARARSLPEVRSGLRRDRVPAECVELGSRRFAIRDLRHQAEIGLPDDWLSPDHWGGLPVGLAYAHGVPYWVEPRAAGPGSHLDVRGEEAFILGVADGEGAIRVTTGGREVSLGPAGGVVAARGWPLCRWALRLYPIELAGGRGRVSVRSGGLVLGVTELRDGPGLAVTILATAQTRPPSGAIPEAVLTGAVRRLASVGGPSRAPVAFIPPHGRTHNALVECAQRLGLTGVDLTAKELVDPRVFTPRRFPVAVYTGDEDYLQTVSRMGDGDEALLRYLQSGGTLVVAGICRPFSYARDLTSAKPSSSPQGPWRLLGEQFELFLLGPGEARPDAIGFEKPPAGVDLTLRVAPEQDALWDVPVAWPFPTSGDVRYRPLTAKGVAAEDRVAPLIVAQGSDGRSYGPAAALIEHHCARFPGARVLWCWGTLLQEPFADRGRLAAELLTDAVASARPADEPMPADLALGAPSGDLRVAVLPPDTAHRDDLVRQACAAMGATPVFLTADQLISPLFFNARSFPIAIQAVGDERFIDTYQSPDDGENAYRRYLREGGSLIVCQYATPFWSELVFEKGEWNARLPQRFWSMSFDLGFETAYGFERPEEPMWLELTAAGQRMWPGVAPRVELNNLSDTRWRSLTPYRSSAAREFMPLAQATRADGTPYDGLAAARIRFLESEYAGARVYYLWGSLVQGSLGQSLLEGCLRDALSLPR